MLEPSPLGSPPRQVAMATARETLSSLEALRDDVLRVQKELRGAVSDLRGKAGGLKASVARSVERVQAEGAKTLAITGLAEQDLEADDSVAAISVERKVEVLEQRLGVLRLEEGERRRQAEMCQLRVELDRERLAARAAEAERSEADAALLVSGRLPGLRAEVVVAEAELEQARERARARAANGPDEQRYHEWYCMLLEDRPEHFSLAVIESERDGWEQRLRDLVSPEATSSLQREPRRRGIDRLDAELFDVGVAAAGGERPPPSSEQCLQALSEEGPWRLVFGELAEAHAFILGLSKRNDALASQISELRWRRANILRGPGTAAASTSLADLDTSQLGAPHLPRGPRFAAPVMAKPPDLARVGVEGLESADALAQAKAHGSGPATRRPVADAAEWEAAKLEPLGVDNDRGLAFLCKTSDRRLRPGGADLAHKGFESNFADEGFGDGFGAFGGFGGFGNGDGAVSAGGNSGSSFGDMAVPTRKASGGFHSAHHFAGAHGLSPGGGPPYASLAKAPAWCTSGNGPPAAGAARDLTQLTADAFKEPLSSALGTTGAANARVRLAASRPGTSGPLVSAGDAARAARAREWVTFDLTPQKADSFPTASGFSPLNTAPAAVWGADSWREPSSSPPQHPHSRGPAVPSGGSNDWSRVPPLPSGPGQSQLPHRTMCLGTVPPVALDGASSAAWSMPGSDAEPVNGVAPTAAVDSPGAWADDLEFRRPTPE